jgi:hypothetical protein
MAARDARVNAIQLFGVVAVDGGHHGVSRFADGAEGVSVVPFRDVGALVASAPYVRLKASEDRVRQYRHVVEGAFSNRTILPAPFGTVFRSEADLARWLELHYFTLVDALAYVEDRVMARVRLEPMRLPSIADTDEISMKVADLETSAAESFRLLRRHAVASIPAPPSPSAGPAAEASFLVERDRWGTFGDVVKEESKRFPELRIEQTGPWPPYDFVRMEFGG